MVLTGYFTKIKRGLSNQVPKGFAINIEGALIEGCQLTPTAKETIHYLNKKKYPYVLLANSTSGRTDAEMVAELFAYSGEKVSSKNIVFPYTAFQHSLEEIYEFKEENVLVIGDPINKIKAIAQSYGLRNAYTPADLHELRRTCEIKVGAIFVFNTPKDQNNDICLMKELLLSRAGWLGTVSRLNGLKELPNRGYGQDEQPFLFWCDDEVMRGTNHRMTRSAHGQFKAAFEGNWNARTGNAAILNAKIEHTFPFVEEKLFKHLKSPTTKIVYLIGNDTATSSLAQVSNYQSLRHIDWRSLMIKGKQLKGSLPPGVVQVKDVSVGVFWASRDARVRPVKPLQSTPPDHNKELPAVPSGSQPEEMIDWEKARRLIRTQVAARLRAQEDCLEPHVWQRVFRRKTTP